MQRWIHLEPADARRVAWRNGRGETLELALWPPDAAFEDGDFEWRVSLAGVTEDGAFSSFAGFERALVVLDGRGLELDHGDEGGRVRMRPLEPHAFDGGWVTWAKLVDGPVRDFGVIVRRGLWRVELDVLRLGERRTRFELEGQAHGFLHVASGALEARLDGEEETVEAAAGDSVWVLPSGRGAELEARGLESGTLALFARMAP